MNQQYVLTMKTNAMNKTAFVDYVENAVRTKRSAYVCVSNVHMCMETYDSPTFRSILSHSDLVVADGRPIYWAQRLLGHSNAQQIRGLDITEEICGLSSSRGIKIGLYGGANSEILDRVVTNLKLRYPNIDIPYAFSPPFGVIKESERESIVTEINSKGVDVLFVGIGCPKQEIWMAKHKGEINCLMIGVGAVFDFISGEKKHAPRWMQAIGLEWIYRLCSEPKRLWRRYLKQNPRFIYHFFLQLFLKKKYSP